MVARSAYVTKAIAKSFLEGISLGLVQAVKAIFTLLVRQQGVQFGIAVAEHLVHSGMRQRVDYFGRRENKYGSTGIMTRVSPVLPNNGLLSRSRKSHRNAE